MRLARLNSDFRDLNDLEPRFTRTMRLAHRADPDPSLEPAGGGSGSDAANQEFNARRMKELEGTAAEALKGQLLQREIMGKQQRDEIRALQAKLKEFDPARTELEGYRVFGKPDELKTKLETLEAERAELTGFRRERSVHEAARITKLEDGRSVSAEKLADLVKLKGFDLDLHDVLTTGEDGKPAKVKAAFVKPTKAGEKAMPLLEYIAAELPTFVDWIAAEDTATGARGSSGQGSGQGAGARVAGQPSGASGAAKAATLDDVIKQKRASGNYQI